MTKIAINGFQKKLGILLFLFILIPEIAQANPIVSFDLYSPFSTQEYYRSFLLMILIGLMLEILVIYYILKKNIDKNKMFWAVLVIFIPIGILNFFTMIIVQVLATFLAFFAEIFPIVVEFFVVYIILKIANKKDILLILPSKKNIFKIILIANFVSFAFGLIVNIGYGSCAGSKTLSKYCKTISEKTSYLDTYVISSIDDELAYYRGRRIKECDKLSDVQQENREYTSHFKCYLDYAVKENDVDFCYLSSMDRSQVINVDSVWYDKENICDMEFAVEKNDYDMCTINNNHSWGYCDSDEKIIPYCYYKIAVAKNEIAGCDKIKDFRINYSNERSIYNRYDEVSKRCIELDIRVKEIENKCYLEVKNN